MSGSGTIQVLKRNRSVEDFDLRKLTAAIWRAISTGEPSPGDNAPATAPQADATDDSTDAAHAETDGDEQVEIREHTVSYVIAGYLADAVLFYISQDAKGCISSAAIFEMCVKVLQHTRLTEAATALQAHHARCQALRRRLMIRHDGDKITLWDKSWLAGLAQRSWHLSPTTARILAGEVERELLTTCEVTAELVDRGDNRGADLHVMDRHSLIELLNNHVAAFGLADAVPARL